MVDDRSRTSNDKYALVLIKAKSEAQIVRSSVVLGTAGRYIFRYLKDISNFHINYLFRQWLVLPAKALRQPLQPYPISNSRLW